MQEVEHAGSVEELRPLLFAIAYRMLGAVADAEDVVQEAFLRWSTADPAQVRSAKAYLSKVVTNLCIDRLRSAQRQRETYVGPWLPEPLLQETVPDAAEAAERADTLSMAFLVVLESLSPLERAAFLLHEVFGYEHAELAGMLGRSEAACRQLVHRAREHVAARRPRFEVDADEQRRLLQSFTIACAMGDLDGLTALLTDDVVLQSDGGGRATAARKPVVGARKVARFLVRVLQKKPPDLASRIVTVNGQPGLATYREDRLENVLTLDVADGRVQGIHIVANPEKLGVSPPGPA
ncbi:MAG TPA: RNA polymerase sigma-70 factor [Actinomycetota bacterium]|jgi:RNA polymerase sigma-70 factor (ECF subfamily)